MYKQLKIINKKPQPFEFYTAESLWTDEYRAKQILSYHLNKEVDLASRNESFIEQSISWIIDEFNITKESRVCDFGCAVGLYTTAFAKVGAKVTGIDFSKNSLEYAKKVALENNLEIRYIHQNYLEYNSDEKYDLITMIMYDFCVLSPEQRKILLNKFYNLLSDDGKVLLDVQSLRAFDSIKESSIYEHNQLYKFWSQNDYYAFVNTFKYEDEKVSLDKYTIIEEDKSYEVYNWFQYFSIESLKKEFESVGLKIVTVYNNVAGEVYCDNCDGFAIVAQKT